MNDILEFLMKYCSFLYETNRFKFADSLVSSSFGGDSVLVLTSDTLRLRFVRDRGQLFLDVQSVHQKNKKHWYSIDLIWRLITGQKQRSAELNKDYTVFLRDHLDEIERRFSANCLHETVEALGKFEQIRAKELFG